MSGPLDGIRVLTLGRGMPTAIAAMLLADYGADVIAVERPGGDGCLDQTPVPWDRGGRRLPLDLTDGSSRRAFTDLAAGADVVLVALPPDAAAALGVGADGILAANPDVVYTAVTGFGLPGSGPAAPGRDLAGGPTPGIDALVAAELGAMVTAPGHRPGPIFLGHPAISYSTALLALIGTLAAVRGRVVSGRGDVVDVSLRDGVLAQLTMNWWSEKRQSFLRSRTTSGGLDLGTTRMVVRSFVCADGRRIQVHSGAAGAFGRLMTVLGLDRRISPATGPVESACPLTEQDLAVLEGLPEIFAARPSTEWLEELWANEVAALPVQEPGEVLDDPQVVHNGLVRHGELPGLGPVSVVAPPIQLRRTPAVEAAMPRPIIEGRPQWLAPGLADGPVGERAGLAAGPLSGIRVVELASFFAAPYANRLLCDLGAEVVKVEPPSGDPIRSLPDPFEGASRGKKSVALDLKDERSRPAIEALLRTADVVQHNLRPGVAERLGFDDASVRRLNPGVVYSYAPGFGSTGPKSRLQSFAPLQSGFVGVHAEAGGQGGTPMPTFGNEDYFNGQLNAVAALLALVHQARTGEGQYVECAQLSSSVFVTSHWYRRAGERTPALGVLDGEQYGWGPYQRIYQCLDGWICLFCTDDSQRRAAVAEVLAGTHPGDDADGQLQYALFDHTAEEWWDRLGRAGVPCAVVNEERWLHQFLFDPEAERAGRVAELDHPTGGRVRVIAKLVNLRSQPGRPAVPPRASPVRAPRVGEHTAEILASLGLDRQP